MTSGWRWPPRLTGSRDSLTCPWWSTWTHGPASRGTPCCMSIGSMTLGRCGLNRYDFAPYDWWCFSVPIKWPMPWPIGRRTNLSQCRNLVQLRHQCPNLRVEIYRIFTITHRIFPFQFQKLFSTTKDPYPKMVKQIWQIPVTFTGLDKANYSSVPKLWLKHKTASLRANVSENEALYVNFDAIGKFMLLSSSD